MKQMCKFLNAKRNDYAHGTIYYSDYLLRYEVIIAVTIVNGCRLLSKTTHLFPKEFFQGLATLLLMELKSNNSSLVTKIAVIVLLQYCECKGTTVL